MRKCARRNDQHWDFRLFLSASILNFVRVAMYKRWNGVCYVSRHMPTFYEIWSSLPDIKEDNDNLLNNVFLYLIEIIATKKDVVRPLSIGQLIFLNWH